LEAPDDGDDAVVIASTEAGPRRSKRLSRIKFRLRALEKKPKLMWMLKVLRCEGVKFNVSGLMLFKDILAHLRLRAFYEME
jgi:hypothetical protein